MACIAHGKMSIIRATFAFSLLHNSSYIAPFPMRALGHSGPVIANQFSNSYGWFVEF